MASYQKGKGQGRRLRVLLVEDDLADAYLTKRSLLELPLVENVIHCRNGKEAVALITQTPTALDIAVVDLKMPLMTGYEFLDVCGAQGLLDIPKIIFTSSAAEADAIRSRLRGALAVITKPQKPEDYQQAIQVAVEAFTG